MVDNEAGRTLLLVVLQNVLFATVVFGAFFGGVLVLRRFFGARLGYSLAALGLRRPEGGYFAGVGTGVLVGFGAVVLGIVVNLVTFFVFQKLGLPTERTVQGPFIRMLSEWITANPGVAIPTIVLVVVIFGPAVEELLWRGAVFGGLYRLGGLLRQRRIGEKAVAPGRVSFVFAAFVSSLVFAALHMEPIIIPGLFLLAFILCALYARTGSLLPSLVAHATFNGFTVGLILLSAIFMPPT